MAAPRVDLGERGGPAGLQGRRSALRCQQRQQRQQRQRRGPPAPHPALLRCCRCCPEPRSAPAPLRRREGSVKAPKRCRRRPPFIRSRAPRERSPRAWRLLTGRSRPPVPAGGAEVVPAPACPGRGGRSVSRLPSQHGSVPQIRVSPLRSPEVGAEGGPGHRARHRELLRGRQQPRRGRWGDPGAAGGEVTPAPRGLRFGCTRGSCLVGRQRNRKSCVKSLF